jgi:hypothetical protein
MPSRATIRSAANTERKKQRTRKSFWNKIGMNKPKPTQVAPVVYGTATAKGVKRRRRKSTKKRARKGRKSRRRS